MSTYVAIAVAKILAMLWFRWHFLKVMMKIVQANKIEFLMTRGNRKIIVLLHSQFLFFSLCFRATLFRTPIILKWHETWIKVLNRFLFLFIIVFFDFVFPDIYEVLETCVPFAAHSYSLAKLSRFIPWSRSPRNLGVVWVSWIPT